MTGLLMACFGLFISSDVLLLIFALLGFGIQGGFVGLYTLSARLYPAMFRTTGVGWAMGAGRVGGIVGPALAGVLIAAGFGLALNFLIFAVPAILSGIITSRIDSENID
jgi:MFS family permease